MIAEARIHLCRSLLGGQLFCTCLEAIPAAVCIYFAYYFYVTNLFLMGIKGFFCIIKKLALVCILLVAGFLYEALRLCLIFSYGSPRENLTCEDSLWWK